MLNRTLTLLAVLTLTGCGDDTTESSAEGDIPRECRDGDDNDDNGLTDCGDPGCASDPICSVAPADTADGDTGGDVPAEDVGDAASGVDAEPDTTTDVDEDTDTSEDTAEDAESDSDAEPDSQMDTSPDTGDAEEPDVPTGAAVRACTTTVEHTAPGASTVQIAGPFTDWADSPITLDSLGGGRFSTELDLPAGEHPFKFIVDDVWDFADYQEVPSPALFYTQWVGNNENRNLIVGDCQVPRLEVLTASSDDDGVHATLRFWSAEDGAPIDIDELRVTVGDVDFAAEVDTETGVITIDAIGLPNGKHSIHVWAADTDGRQSEEEPAYIPLWVEDEPFVWQDAVMYFVFTDRFRDSDDADRPIDGVPEIANYQGGDFQGVIDAIEEGYFTDLGVNLLWLSPVQENPDGDWLASDRFHQFSGFHGYWPTHARQIEERWGTEEADADELLRELIDTAHDNGIRVLFDVPLNHVHESHEYTTMFPEWFTADACPCTTDPGPCNWDQQGIDGGQLMCWFIEYLPDLDYRNHEIVMQMTADTEWMVTEFDVDGLRLDAAKHMHHVILRRLTRRIDERFVNDGAMPLYLVGETFTGGDGHGLIMDYVNDGELDGQFDFPLLYPIQNAFARNGSFRDLSNGRWASETNYGRFYDWMSPFLGNHDIPRFSSEVFGVPDPWSNAEDPMAAGLNDQTWNLVNRLSMGFLFVLTQPGVPLIYYGDEIGLYGGGDPDNRRMMPWGPLSDAQLEVRGRIQAVGQARQNLVALRRGQFRELWVDDNFFVYARVTDAGDVAIVAMNKGEGSSRVVPNLDEIGLGGASLVDYLGGSRNVNVSGDGNGTFTLNSWEYAIFVTE